MISGFPELRPSERFVELAVIERLREVFELHGFAPLETAAVETLDTLLRKGEIDKEVYVLRRLQAETDSSDSGLGLHYDLTVPFARYVLDHAGHLEFPFRRYQIQPVWRGERPQQGRYRQFTQADIDIVGRDTLGHHHDVEVARVMAEALSRLDFLPPLTLQVNNRRLIEGFYRSIGVPDPIAVLRIMDKIDKMDSTAHGELLTAAGLTSIQKAKSYQLADIRTSDDGFYARVLELTDGNLLLMQGLDELRAVVRGCQGITGVSVVADLRIARGLDYYTGTVFETRMAGWESLGSVCSGGRYDSLASDGKTTYPGVGISLGLSRLLLPLLNAGTLRGSRAVPSAVLVALMTEESRPESDAIAGQLRANGVPCEVAAAPQKLGKQIKYAERRGIPFVWFPDGGSDGSPDRGRVRDIRTGEQVEADPATWTPPAADLRPQVLTDQ